MIGAIVFTWKFAGTPSASVVDLSSCQSVWIAGVVEQDVDAVERRRLASQGNDLVVIRWLGGQEVDRETAAANRRRCAEVCSSSALQDQAAALLRESSAALPADASAGARQQHPFARDAQHHDLLRDSSTARHARSGDRRTLDAACRAGLPIAAPGSQFPPLVQGKSVAEAAQRM